jgi:hypothetical protein
MKRGYEGTISRGGKCVSPCIYADKEHNRLWSQSVAKILLQWIGVLGWVLKTVMNGGFGAFGLWKTRIKSGENDGCKVLA